jgi:uncharacterized protein (DUF1330 family)
MTKRYLLASILAACAAALMTLNPAWAQMPSSGLAGAYFISEFEVTDAVGIRPYSAAVESTFKPFGGWFVVRGGNVASLEGAPVPRVIMIAFPTRELAQAWYDSDVYAAIRPIRERSANSRVFIMEALQN